MKIEARRPADFFRVLDPAYDHFVQNMPEDPTFEVVFTEADYRDESFKLLDLRDAGRADVKLSARDPDGRVRLSGGYVQIDARTIQLDGLTLDDFQSSYPSLLLQARTGIDLTNCAFTRLSHHPDYAGEALMRLRPGFRESAPTHLHIDACAWIGCHQRKEGALISLADMQRRWSSVVIENSIFLGCEAAQGILLGMTEQITLRHCFVQTFPAFLVVESPNTRLTVEDCILVGDDFIVDASGGEDAPEQARITPENLDRLTGETPDQFAFRGNRVFPAAAAAGIDVPGWIDSVQRGILPTVEELTALCRSEE